MYSNNIINVIVYENGFFFIFFCELYLRFSIGRRVVIFSTGKPEERDPTVERLSWKYRRRIRHEGESERTAT